MATHHIAYSSSSSIDMRRCMSVHSDIYTSHPASPIACAHIHTRIYADIDRCMRTKSSCQSDPPSSKVCLTTRSLNAPTSTLGMFSFSGQVRNACGRPAPSSKQCCRNTPLCKHRRVMYDRISQNTISKHAQHSWQHCHAECSHTSTGKKGSGYALVVQPDKGES